MTNKCALIPTRARWLTRGNEKGGGISVETHRGVTILTRWSNFRGVYSSVTTLSEEGFPDALKKALRENPPVGRVVME